MEPYSAQQETRPEADHAPSLPHHPATASPSSSYTLIDIMVSQARIQIALDAVRQFDRNPSDDEFDPRLDSDDQYKTLIVTLQGVKGLAEKGSQIAKKNGG
jgi:hypothetical protein